MILHLSDVKEKLKSLANENAKNEEKQKQKQVNGTFYRWPEIPLLHNLISQLKRTEDALIYRGKIKRKSHKSIQLFLFFNNIIGLFGK